MNEVITSHKNAFNNAKLISQIGNYILCISTFVALFTSFSSSFFENIKKLNEILNQINIVIILLYILSEILVNSLLPLAEMSRRFGLLDNSFDTNFTGKKSHNYYNNEKLTPGLKKLASNCFESSLFTYEISKKMILPLALKNMIILIVFLLAAYLGERQILILLSQLTLPIVLIQQFIKLCIFVNTNYHVLNNFRILFDELKTKKDDDKAPLIIKNIIQYESNISWASIMLDSKIYTELNPKLSIEWDECKKLYKIDEQ